MLVFKDVKVPWEKVIVHDNPGLSRNIYIQTAAHVISNHQSNVRFGSKLRFMLGVASLVTRFTGARDIPAVRDTLGRLAAMEAGYNAMIDGQIEACQPFDNGFVVFNRRYLYAAIHWAMENHSAVDRHHARADGRRPVPVSRPASTCWRIPSCARCSRHSGPPANSPPPTA